VLVPWTIIANGVLQISLQIAVPGAAFAVLFDDTWRHPKRFQFSLSKLLTFVTCLAIVMAILAWALNERRKTLERSYERVDQIMAEAAKANAVRLRQPVQTPESPVE
jgi:hypothetical protein